MTSQLLQQSELRVLIERTTKKLHRGADRVINFNTMLANNNNNEHLMGLA